MARTLLLAFALACAFSAVAEHPISTPVIINTHAHNPGIFTQGLALDKGRLYWSSGLRGQSQVITGTIGSEQISARFHFPDRYFAEGLAIVGEEVMVLTWQAGELFVLDKRSLQLKFKREYAGEGWGLCYDGQQLWLSDGSARIRRYHPQTLAPLGSIEVHDQHGPVRRINELEWAGGKLLANIWHSTRLIAIDPDNGRVSAEWELEALLPQTRRFGYDSVANGIAYDPSSGHFWLTGKGWPHIYEVELPGLATD